VHAGYSDPGLLLQVLDPAGRAPARARPRKPPGANTRSGRRRLSSRPTTPSSLSTFRTLPKNYNDSSTTPPS